MPSRPLLVRLLIGANALVLILAGASLATTADKEASSATDGPGSSADPSLQAASPTPGEPQESPGDGEASEQPSQDQQPAEPPRQRAEGPPDPGVYTYRETSTDQEGNTSEQEREVSVENLGAGAEGTRQKASFSEQSTTVELFALWRSDGAWITHWKVSSPQGSFECDWEPDYPHLELPLEVGAEWSSDVSCDTQVDSQPGRFRQQETARVVGTEKVDVGGVSVDTFVIERTTKLESEFGAFQTTQDITERENLSLRYGLEVRSHGTSKTMTPDGQSFEMERKLELLSLTPK